MENTDTVTTEEVAPETTEVAGIEEVVTTEETTETEEVVTEETLFAGKYKTAGELEKGYSEMQSLYNSRYKGFTGAPESGEYEVTASEGTEQTDIEAIADSPVFAKFKERGLERGMSNDMFNEVINDYVTTQRETNQSILDGEMKKLGDDANARIDNVVNKLGTLLEGEQLEGLKQTLSTAASIEALETLLDKDVNTIAPADIDVDVDTSDKEAELQELWNAKDAKGRRKMEYDADYRNTVNKKWKDFYGE